MLNTSYQSNKEGEELQQILRLADDNRLESEQELKDYKDDSLKFEIAKFLIRNMSG